MVNLQIRIIFYYVFSKFKTCNKINFNNYYVLMIFLQ
jgi:hypothetical protein